VECFRFLLTVNIVAAPELQTTSAVQATTVASVSSISQKIGRVSRLRHIRDWRNRQIKARFAAGPAFDLLATCLRPACDTLTQVCDQIFDQVCS